MRRVAKPAPTATPEHRIEPYYRSEDGAITVYNARWEDVLAAGLVPVREVKLIHADPPYGVAEKTDRSTRISRSSPAPSARALKWPAIVGDAAPFDPAPLLALKKPTVLWGANHYANRLPGSASYILWDKRVNVAPDDNADGELAWTNLGGPLRIFRHLWRAFCRASESGSHLGPTQKPEALSAYVFQRTKLKRGDLVFVPYLGSGPDLRVARAMGLRIVACDVEEWCCKTAVSARLGAVPHPEVPAELGPLFSAAGERHALAVASTTQSTREAR